MHQGLIMLIAITIFFNVMALVHFCKNDGWKDKPLEDWNFGELLLILYLGPAILLYELIKWKPLKRKVR
jgi:hypothetical protein